MTLQEILTGGGSILVVVLTVLQLAPIKINPWGAIAKALGRAINAELTEKVTGLERKVADIKEETADIKAETAEERAVSCRARILRFGDEVLHGTRHSKDHFDQTLLDIKKYNDYCRTHPDFPNDVTELTSERIKAVYRERLQKNDFL